MNGEAVGDRPPVEAAGAGERSAVLGVVVVSAAIAPMQKEPRVSSPQISQLLAAHSAQVLAEESDWLHVRGRDGYEGWVHRGYLRARFDADPGVGDRTITDPSADPAPRVSLGCVVATAEGARKTLPLGARLFPDERVQQGEAVPLAALRDRFPPSRAAVAKSATTLFVGAPYQWGGVTPWGADCSGFTQLVFGLHGITLPRDAWQQAGAGAEADSADPAAADLLFFSDREDRRPSHVAVALGAHRVAHVALGRGGFRIERLDDAEDPYVRRLLLNVVGARSVVP